MTAPIKTCDYCGATGEMPTFMSGETICYTCLRVLPKTLPEAQQELMRLRAVLAGVEQPAANFADAYQGAMEEVAIWKKRALEAEDLNRKFVAEINGPTYMGEPAQPELSVPDGWLRAIDEALVTAHIGVANAHDTYEQAREKLNNLIGWHVDIATDPAVNGGWKLVPIVSTDEMDDAGAEHGDGYLSTAQVVWDAMLAAAPKAKP